MYDFNELFSNAIELSMRKLMPEFSAVVRSVIEDSLASAHGKAPNDELLTITEAAKFLNCSRTTLWSYTKRNYIDSYRIGQKVFFKKSELMKSLKKRNPKSK